MLRTDLSGTSFEELFSRLLSEKYCEVILQFCKIIGGKNPFAFIEEFGILKLMHFKTNIYVWSLGHFYIC